MIVFNFCLKLFLCRVVNIIIDTINTYYVIRREKLKSFVTSFIDVLMWYFIINIALNSIYNIIWVGIAYALGYVFGAYIGMIISTIIIKGNFILKVITDHVELIELLKDKGIGITTIKTMNNKYIIYTSINKKRHNEIKKFINNIDSNSFITVMESKEICNGYFAN